MTSSPFRRCFVTSLVLGLSATNTLSAQVSAAAAAAAATAFRSGLVATALPSPSVYAFLTTIALTWPAYSSESRYRVLRAVTQTGPWVLDHDVVGLADTVRRLPPSTAVYLRVAALHAVTAVKLIGVEWVAGADTTNTTYAITSPSKMGWDPTLPVYGRCSYSPPSTFRFVWHGWPDVSGYRLHPLLWGNPVSVALPTLLIAADTFFVQGGLAAGTYTYSFEPRYDLSNWPVTGQTKTVYGPKVMEAKVVVGPFLPLDPNRTSCL
jgi:hypothetical protein